MRERIRQVDRPAHVTDARRLELLVGELHSRDLDRLLVGVGANLRYVTGFTGSNGLAVLDAGERCEHRFLTDFRYATQSAEQVFPAFAREIAQGDLLEAAAELFVGDGATGTTGRAGRLGFDDAALTVKQHRRLHDLLDGSGWELVACAGIVEHLREVKDEAEIARIRAACELADGALSVVLADGLVGRSERELAIDLELQGRRLGATGPSFPSIVAGGAHAALPHAEPRDAPIEQGALVTIDWGMRLDGYCSDCTRTFAVGQPSEQAQAIYALVLQAQEAALAAVRPGIGGRELDAVAREIIERAGHGEHFGHGLGHGVGIEVHEAPRLSRTAGDEPLRVGNVVTVEPGVYLPGRLGVRIEDLVVVRDGGCERLTALSKELTAVG